MTHDRTKLGLAGWVSAILVGALVGTLIGAINDDYIESKIETHQPSVPVQEVCQ